MNSSSLTANENGVIALLNVDETSYEAISNCNFAGCQLMQFKNGTYHLLAEE